MPLPKIKTIWRIIMNNLFRSITVLAAVMVLVGCAQLLVSGQSDQSNVRSIEGIWQTTVTPRICATGTAVGPTFPGILMFSSGGTMTGTSTAVTSTYGVWRRESGARQYSFTALSLKYDAAGAWIGSRRISQNVTVDETGSGFLSGGTFQDYDTSGNPTITGCSTSTGTRFE
jgi:hypothetical protein